MTDEKFKREEIERIFRLVRPRLSLEFTDQEIYDELEKGAVPHFVALYFSSKQKDYCVRCGDCCRTQSPINLLHDELSKIAHHENVGRSGLVRSLHMKREKEGSFSMPGLPCPFLKGENTCTIYDIRPFICRAYPVGVVMRNEKVRPCAVTRELVALSCMVNLAKSRVPSGLSEEIRRALSQYDPEDLKMP